MSSSQVALLEAGGRPTLLDNGWHVEPNEPESPWLAVADAPADFGPLGDPQRQRPAIQPGYEGPASPFDMGPAPLSNFRRQAEGAAHGMQKSAEALRAAGFRPLGPGPLSDEWVSELPSGTAPAEFLFMHDGAGADGPASRGGASPHLCMDLREASEREILNPSIPFMQAERRPWGPLKPGRCAP